MNPYATRSSTPEIAFREAFTAGRASILKLVTR